ncbi:MAG: biotin-dependent carboxyltransferase family protein [Bacteroidota bacterium]
MDNRLLVWVKRAGMFTTLQDQGHAEHLEQGLPIGGAMDRMSARIANELVGNPADSQVLEITIGGPTLLFDSACQIAITGADISPQLDDIPLSLNSTHQVLPGQILSFGRCKNGCRSYLAIGGQFLSPKVSPLHGPQMLQQDEVLEVALAPFVDLSQKQPKDFKDKLTVTLYPGPEFDLFSRSYLAHFFSCEWRISPQSNRMGYRLQGPEVPDPGITEIHSSGILPGTVQVSGDGSPVILLADAQTTGGYPRIGVIAQKCLDPIGQLRPGHSIRFVWAAVD